LTVDLTESTKAGNSADSTDEVFMNTCVQELKKMNVIVKSKNDEKTFRALKNALSHTHIKIGNENGVITKIQFEDKLNNVCHTKLEFNVQQLKGFALFVANLHLMRQNT